MNTIFFDAENIALAVFSDISVDAVADYFLRNKRHLAESMPVREPRFYTAGFWAEQQARYAACAAAGSALQLFLLHAERVVGHVAFDQIVKGPFQACYLGYGIDSQYQGRGLMRKALASALAHVSCELELNRVMANYTPDNVRSGRLLKSLGFEREGYARRYLKLNGGWKDHILTSLVMDDDYTRTSAHEHGRV